MASNPRNTHSKKATNLKPSTSKAKRPRAASEPPENVIHFINDQAQEFPQSMKSFEVVGERKFDFTRLVKYPFFEAELRRRGWTKLNEVIEEANNKTVIVEFFANARVSDTPFQSFVRGKTIDFSPEALNEWLSVQPPEECWVEKLRRERFGMTEDTFDDIITTMCRPGSTWKKSRMLTYAEMLPIPKAWVSYLVQTLESVSCTFEIPLKTPG